MRRERRAHVIPLDERASPQSLYRLQHLYSPGARSKVYHQLGERDWLALECETLQDVALEQ